MAISFDNSTVAPTVSFATATQGYNYLRAAGDGVLIVGIGYTIDGVAVDTVEYNSELLTLVGVEGNGVIAYEMWRLDNPASSGIQPISINMQNTASVIVSGVISFSGSPNIAAFNFNIEEASGVTTLDNALTVDDQSWIVLVGAADNVDVTAGTNVTTASTGNPLMGRFGPRSGAGSTTLTINASVSSYMVSITNEIAPAVVAGGQPIVKRFGGTPFMGGNGLGGSKTPGRTWYPVR